MAQVSMATNLKLNTCTKGGKDKFQHLQNRHENPCQPTPWLLLTQKMLRHALPFNMPCYNMSMRRKKIIDLLHHRKGTRTTSSLSNGAETVLPSTSFIQYGALGLLPMPEPGRQKTCEMIPSIHAPA